MSTTTTAPPTLWWWWWWWSEQGNFLRIRPKLETLHNDTQCILPAYYVEHHFDVSDDSHKPCAMHNAVVAQKFIAQLKMYGKWWRQRRKAIPPHKYTNIHMYSTQNIHSWTQTLRRRLLWEASCLRCWWLGWHWLDDDDVFWDIVLIESMWFAINLHILIANWFSQQKINCW